MTFIRFEKLSVRYGSVLAVDSLDIEVERGSVVCLLGANGAGKSTALRTFAGLVKPSSGRIMLDGNDVTGLSPDKMVRRGVSLSPEGRRLFAEMSVMENLRLGAYLNSSSSAHRRDMERVFGYFPRLRERMNQRAGSLSGGEQQMCAIGRAMMSNPQVLLLDEPSLGLAPIMIAEVARIVRTINAEGITVLIVEQNARLALQLSNFGYILETGRLALEGPAADLLHDEHVRGAYLGGTGGKTAGVA